MLTEIQACKHYYCRKSRANGYQPRLTVLRADLRSQVCRRVRVSARDGPRRGFFADRAHRIVSKRTGTAHYRLNSRNNYTAVYKHGNQLVAETLVHTPEHYHSYYYKEQLAAGLRENQIERVQKSV